VPARFIEAVELNERFKGEVVWQGAVKVFALEGHPSRARPVPAIEAGVSPTETWMPAADAATAGVFSMRRKRLFVH